MFQISFKDAFCGWHYEISFLSKILGNIFLLHVFSKFGNFVLSKKQIIFLSLPGLGSEPIIISYLHLFSRTLLLSYNRSQRKYSVGHKHF
jgi:hypothetical protein